MFDKNGVIEKLQHNPNWDVIISEANQPYETYVINEERAKNFANLLGYSLLGIGSNRFTINVDGYAVKIPLYDIGFAENQKEAEIWNSLPKKAKQYFTPYIGGKKELAIFELAETLTESEFDSIKTKKILRELSKLGIEVVDIESYDQWGYVSGKLLILDYTETTFK